LELLNFLHPLDRPTGEFVGLQPPGFRRLTAEKDYDHFEAVSGYARCQTRTCSAGYPCLDAGYTLRPNQFMCVLPLKVPRTLVVQII
jgi:hypothetical protein